MFFVHLSDADIDKAKIALAELSYTYFLYDIFKGNIKWEEVE